MNIYQHYRQDERPFIDQVFEWIHAVKDTYAYRTTDFLDPRQQEIATQIARYDSEVNVYFYGGIERAERKRSILTHPYYEPASTDFNVTFFEVNYPTKFFTLEHRHVLGALMNLGIKREKFGDIFIAKETVQITVASEIAEFVTLNLQSIGKATVTLKEITETDLITPEDDWRAFTGTVTALRLDATIAEIFNLSRARAHAAIQKGLVRVNWKTVEDPAFECSAYDTISVRGSGRANLQAIDGQTRKGRWRIHYRKK